VTPDPTEKLQKPTITPRDDNESVPTLPLMEPPDAIVDSLIPEDFEPLVPGSGRVTPVQQTTEAPAAQSTVLINGRFLLKEEIGSGGMGIVFRAIDRRKTEARDPNPQVALKILNSQVARHPAALMALQREARKAQSLAHPNVATVFDFDRDDDLAYMTMELLRGRSLEEVLRDESKKLDREAALSVVRGIAEGLAYAHRKGIVHSDLKPGNVFLTDEGVTKILDFGIARAMPGVTAGPRDLFDASSLGAGTLAYATAEMIGGGDPHPADDVYALGLIAYQLFTGKHPYQRLSAPKAREAGLKAAPPPGLSRRQWRVLEQSLSFDRELRPRDAGEFLARFFGVHRSRKVLVAAVLCLGVLGAFSTYRYYQASGPQIPFETLPPQARQDFARLMKITFWPCRRR
jgi:serine/threonine protein kinase